MPVRVQCPECNQVFRVAGAHEGVVLRCPTCHKKIRIAAVAPSSDKPLLPDDLSVSERPGRRKRTFAIGGIAAAVVLAIVLVVALWPRPWDSGAAGESPKSEGVEETASAAKGRTFTAEEWRAVLAKAKSRGASPPAGGAAPTAQPRPRWAEAPLVEEPAQAEQASPAAAPTGEHAESRRLSPQEVANRAMPSVVMLVMQDAHSQPISLGSGFFVAKNTVATNLHVVRGAARGHVKRVGRNELYDVTGVVAMDSASDLVLLSVSESDTPSIRIDTARQVALGDRILVLGNPRGLEGTLSDGIISGIRELEPGRIIQITAPISPGSSGGPVLNEYGEVVGVAVATVDGGQNLNFAIPSAMLSGLLGRAGKPLPLSEAVGEAKKGPKSEVPGEAPSQAVAVSHIRWGGIELSFSLHNRLARPIERVRLRILFYDGDGVPVHFEDYCLHKAIPAGLALRTSHSSNEMGFVSGVQEAPGPKGRLEFRVLDYEFADPQ